MLKFFDMFKKKKEEKQFPPVPKWQPKFGQPLDQVIGSIKHYSNGKKTL
jgi:hypothetical protein